MSAHFFKKNCTFWFSSIGSPPKKIKNPGIPIKSKIPIPLQYSDLSFLEILIGGGGTIYPRTKIPVKKTNSSSWTAEESNTKVNWQGAPGSAIPRLTFPTACFNPGCMRSQLQAKLITQSPPTQFILERQILLERNHIIF